MTSEADPNHTGDFDLSPYKELFLVEARTFLTTLRQGLTRLAADPSNTKARQEARRAAHTLKGMAATMRYEDLASRAKQLESLLFSESEITLNQIEVLLTGCDDFELGLDQLDGGDAPTALTGKA